MTLSSWDGYGKGIQNPNIFVHIGEGLCILKLSKKKKELAIIIVLFLPRCVLVSQQLSAYTRTAGGAQAQSDGGRAPLGVIVLLATIHFLPQQGTNLGVSE